MGGFVAAILEANNVVLNEMKRVKVEAARPSNKKLQYSK